MSFLKIFRNPKWLFWGFLITFVTILSYWEGSKTFFLLPLILIPLFLVLDFFILPIINPKWLFRVSLITYLTFLSYNEGFKFFFLIPLISIPLFLVLDFFVLPIINPILASGFWLLASGFAKLKTPLRKTSRNFMFFYIGSCIFVITFLSYREGEKFFFMIPLILTPLYLVQYYFFLPMVYLFFPFGVAKFEEVDISCLKSLFMFAVFFEFSLGVSLLGCAFYYGEFVPSMIIYAVYAILTMTFLTFRFKSKLLEEAERQKIYVKFKNFSCLFATIREQITREQSKQNITE